ncbi:MAG: lipopolysaccharide biosynthesis protein [Rhodobacteraceae bacterium]|nr:lipopolysaccharide biosynthesis protein [Paracoccaceae bacterium]
MSYTEAVMEPREKPAEFRRNVGRNAKWSILQTVISALSVFVLYKYLYSYLGPEQLGLWAVVVASVSLGRLAELGFSTTILRYVSMHLASGDRVRAARILETGLVSIGAPFALALAVFYPIADQAIRYVVPASNLGIGREVLPYALATLWFGVMGSILQSALDGCGRMDVKSRILVIGILLYVPAAIFVVRHWGIGGLAACQLLQSILVTVLVWGAARHELPCLKWAPLAWDKTCFREIIGYAAGLQLGNLLLMLFEPATKILLGRYCGLSEVAYFEMANQVVSRVRALITSSIQAYLPVLASSATNTNSARQVVGEAMTFTAGIGLPVMAALVVSYPVISILWIGRLQMGFITYGWILGIGWLTATLAMPAYYYCVGAGRVRTILLSQVLTVGLNGLLGFGAAVLGLGHWVAMTMMVSLAIGNLAIARQTLIDLKVTSRQILQSAVARSVIKTVGMTVLVLIFNVCVSVASSQENYLYANFVVHALILLLIAYLSEARGIIATRYRRSG